MAEPSTRAAHFAVQSIVDNFHYQLQSKEVANKLPSHIHDQITRSNDHMLFVGNLPKPTSRYVDNMKEDVMVLEPACEPLLTGGVPTFRRQDWLRLQNSTQLSSQRGHISSRYASTSELQRKKQHVKIDLNSLKPEGLVEVVKRAEPTTAKSFRSVIELDNQLRQMRSSYLKQLKEEVKLKMSMTQQLQPPKKKKIPRDFTYGISGQILERRPYFSKKTVFAPLKSKSVSVQKIQSTKKRSMNNPQEQDNLQQILQRANTKTGERKKRQYSNESKRQVSHIPFISLAENTKLHENLSILLGPQSPKTLSNTKRENIRSTFTHYFRGEVMKDCDLVDEDQEIVNYPCSYQPEKHKIRNMQGTILKNSRFGVKDGKGNLITQGSLDYNPANVTRDHGIDKYYKIKRSTQFQQ